MIDPKRTTRSREEKSADSLYQTATKLYAAADIADWRGDADAKDLWDKADRAWRRAENLDEAIAAGHYGPSPG